MCSLYSIVNSPFPYTDRKQVTFYATSNRESRYNSSYFSFNLSLPVSSNEVQLSSQTCCSKEPEKGNLVIYKKCQYVQGEGKEERGGAKKKTLFLTAFQAKEIKPTWALITESSPSWSFPTITPFLLFNDIHLISASNN